MRTALVLALAVCPALAQSRRLTLDEAVDLAIKQNSVLKLAHRKAEEAGLKTREVRASYYPQISNNSLYFYATELQRVEFPAGALGQIPGVGPLPPSNLSLFQGARNYALSTTSLAQPLTQLYKVRHGEEAARADAQIAEENVRKGRQELVYGIYQLYFGLLISQKQLSATAQRIALAEENLRDASNAVTSGNALQVAELGRKAQVLEAQQARLALENQVADLMAELNDATGLPLNTPLELEPPSPDMSPLPALPDLVKQAIGANPQVREAELTVAKAREGLTVAKAEFIPEVTALAQYVFQSGVPFFPTNNGLFGGQFKFDILDWGKRQNVVQQRQSGVSAAEENLRRVRNRVAVEIEKSYRKVERSRKLVDVSAQALEYRRESERISKDQVEAGTATQAVWLEAQSNRAGAEADFFAATIGARLSKAELDKVAGIN